MENKQKIFVAIASLLIAGILIYIFVLRDDIRSKKVEEVKQHIEEKSTSMEVKNEGPVSPISGIACENWNRRPIAVSQPAEVKARPAAGFSQADMVIEMPTQTSSKTRLAGVYLCDIPEDIGAIRSARHDFIHLLKGLDAIFVHWGGSAFAYNKLNKGVIDNADCMVYSGKYCGRWEPDGKRALEDRSRITGENLLKMIEEKGFRRESKFAGYPHQEEVSESERPEGGHLRVAFGGSYEVEYEYNKETNSYDRFWSDVEDVDKNNGKRHSPKNIVVLIASSSQIMISDDFVGKGLEDPWAEIPEIKSTGAESISGRYNNVQIGDPWYDTIDSGDAYYYMNGQQYRGQWKKDKSDIASKLFFYDEAGKEVAFVPGQIWVEILEPGQTLRWTPAEALADETKIQESN